MSQTVKLHAIKDFQGPTLFSRTFKVLNLEKKFQHFQEYLETVV